MIIKNEKFELEISNGIEIYFGSRTSGQVFKKWEDFKDEEKQQIELIQNAIEKLLKKSEKIFLKNSNNWMKVDI